MKIEKQVCEIELAKKLKELGVKQDSVFYWDDFYEEPQITFGLAQWHNEHLDFIYSAFTVAELGEMLPHYYFTLFKGVWIGSMIPYDKRIPKFLEIADKTEANARAKLLIYLLENKLIP